MKQSLASVIKKPLLTEKITFQTEKLNKYGFEVSPWANKIQVAQAVEKRFNVKVKCVNIKNIRGKVKRLNRFEGKRADKKQAIVTLKEGFTIELFEGTV